LPTANATQALGRGRAIDEGVAEPLVIALRMIVLDELGKGSSQMALAEGDHTVETFSLDRSHEPFRVRIRVGGLERCADDLEPGLVQKLLNGPAPLRVPVADQHAMADQPEASAAQRRIRFSSIRYARASCRLSLHQPARAISMSRTAATSITTGVYRID
jgi:hypothetical protein